MSDFLRSRRGSILIEAAIAFPVLVVILLGMVEFGVAFTVKRRNAQVASTAADLVAQVSCVTTSNLQDIAYYWCDNPCALFVFESLHRRPPHHQRHAECQ